MTRGVRGATTVTENNETEIIENTRTLVIDMIKQNNIQAEMVSHVFISVTNDLNATFPAKALREIDGWTYVPVMCMREIDVPNSLQKCIRIMMVVHTDAEQKNVHHVFHNDAIKLRPDLVGKNGEQIK